MSALLVATSAFPASTPTPDLAPFTATLDALIGCERPDGGWTFEGAPGRRPQPFTFVMRAAEADAEPLGLAHWDLLVVRSPGTPAAGVRVLGRRSPDGRPTSPQAPRPCS